MINVYTDGACSNNGKSNALSGYGIYFADNDPRNLSQKIDGNKHTNNIAELTAFIKVFDILNDDIIKGEQINIYTDSEYVIKCASSYGDKLSKNNWKTSNDKNPPNLELVKKAHQLYKNLFNVKLIHISAHTNKDDIHSIGNENADKLANLAIGVDICPYNNNNNNNKNYINISYFNKELAKNLGAKWDNNKKSWYYDNTLSDENIINLKKLEYNNNNSFTSDVSSSTNDTNKNYINISFNKKNIAKSYGAKWDNNKKSWYYLDSLSTENIDKLKDLQL
jgi:ribonuclease HI